MARITTHLLFASFAFNLASFCTEISAAPGVAVERFKSFLSAPPIIKNLVFSARQAPDPARPWRTDIPFTNSHSFKFYQARWQPGAFSLREITSSTAVYDPRTPGILAAHFKDSCWFHFGQETNDLRFEFGMYSTNAVCEEAYDNSALLRNVLNLGIMHTDPGTIEWSESKFTVRKLSSEIRASGHLNISESGQVDSLDVTYSGPKGDIHWLIRYDYEAGTDPSGLPSGISAYWLNGNQTRQRDEFRIHRLETAVTPLAKNQFDPAAIARANKWYSTIFTNEAVYTPQANGELTMVASLRKNSPSLTFRQPSAADLNIAYVVWIALNLVLFALAWRAKTQQKQQMKEL